MNKLYKIAAAHAAYFKNYHKYKMVFWDKFDYDLLSRNIMYYKKKGKFQKGTWNDVVIAADTETSKGHEITKDKYQVNHVCAWTISIRAYRCNIVTLYGTRPSEMMQCIQKIRDALKGDEFIIYFHNMAYDYYFLRQFIFIYFGTPKKELNTKPHYPICLKFENGLVLKDSLILAQCKLEKWAKDLNVKHQKAVGSWDYDLIRDQGETFSRSELHYIENDTLALVECIDALCIKLNKTISSLCYTATGIVREEVREIGKENNAHAAYLKQALLYDQYIKFTKLYHGGFCLANRFYVGDIIEDNVEGADFNSSYPFCLLCYKYPSGKFIPLDRDVDEHYILDNCEEWAFIFRCSFFNIRLKDHLLPMPALQASHCEHTINMKTYEGRILRAGYASIYMCDQDLLVMSQIYEWDECVCSEVEISRKRYLPRWFTDYVYQRYSDKCLMKPHKAEDPVGYALSKARVNLLYGLTVEKNIRENWIEVTEAGEYKANYEGDTLYYESGEYRIDYDKDPKELYEKKVNNYNTMLNYTIGCYCTAYAFRNLFLLGDCVKKVYKEDGKLLYPPHWYYSDTDSCYSDEWDKEKIAEYNQRCKDLLLANGYGPVKVGNKEYWLGVAEIDPEDSVYTEFTVLGAKRYAGRAASDGKLHITVAGVPKKGAECLNDDLKNFRSDFIFDGKVTGKLTHYYVPARDGIYTDAFGNEIGDSIDLQPCNYELDSTEKEEYIFTDEFYFTYYGEDGFTAYDN